MINFMANKRGFTEDDSKDCRSNINEDQEEDNGFRCYKEQTQELMMDSSSPTIDGGSGGVGDDADVSEVHNFIRRSGGGESSDALGLGSCTSGSGVMIEKEHMFDKAVTPSDVGKLNRLVIPKQHAEKYFPLDSSTNDKGLLLNFEDRHGKPWRFRYSYWNSSQSYVMTKGWSRFVKEKKLDAGDIVSFHRGVGELGKDRLFIDWRRRPDAPELQPPIPAFSLPNHFSFRTWNHPLFLPPQAREHVHLQQANAINGPQSHQINSGYSYGNTNLYGSGSMIYLKSATTAAGGGGAPQQVGMVQVQRGGGVEGMSMPMTMTPMVFESVPVVQGKAAAKRLRLFGVNMECPISESDECDILSSTTVPHSTIAPQPSHLSSSSIPSLPLRPYNANEVLNKGKASMSLDFDI